jgi:membrane protease YdiL (CAAX protease family)
MLFEGSLIGIAAILATAMRISLVDAFRPRLVSVLWGFGATIPMVAGYGAARRSRWPALVRIRKALDDLLPGLFGRAGWPALAIAAALAGFGEEALFRGVFQEWLAHPMGLVGAIVVVSAVFGLLHAITPTYAIVAAALSIYLGAIAALSHSVLAPAIAHGLYDFVVMIDLVWASGLTEE